MQKTSKGQKSKSSDPGKKYMKKYNSITRPRGPTITTNSPGLKRARKK